MTTQRDRLAAVLRAVAGEGRSMTVQQQADALFARGVRIVDLDALAAALRGIGNYAVYDDPPARSRRDAEWLLAALDEADR